MGRTADSPEPAAAPLDLEQASVHTTTGGARSTLTSSGSAGTTSFQACSSTVHRAADALAATSAPSTGNSHGWAPVVATAILLAIRLLEIRRK